MPGYGGPEGAPQPFTVAPVPLRAIMQGTTDTDRPGGGGARLGLPTAATCFNRLCLPAYPEDAQMLDGLLEANRNSGFHEGAAVE